MLPPPFFHGIVGAWMACISLTWQGPVGTFSMCVMLRELVLDRSTWFADANERGEAMRGNLWHGTPGAGDRSIHGIQMAELIQLVKALPIGDLSEEVFKQVVLALEASVSAKEVTDAIELLLYRSHLDSGQVQCLCRSRAVQQSSGAKLALQRYVRAMSYRASEQAWAGRNPWLVALQLLGNSVGA
ncbi:MAG: hypothetical protein KDI56_15070 [Xanthomonadales bacterium]|nr:hypothetical protein [Xanthomonadales bacterium]